MSKTRPGPVSRLGLFDNDGSPFPVDALAVGDLAGRVAGKVAARLHQPAGHVVAVGLRHPLARIGHSLGVELHHLLAAQVVGGGGCSGTATPPGPPRHTAARRTPPSSMA